MEPKEKYNTAEPSADLPKPTPNDITSMSPEQAAASEILGSALAICQKAGLEIEPHVIEGRLVLAFPVGFVLKAADHE